MPIVAVVVVVVAIAEKPKTQQRKKKKNNKRKNAKQNEDEKQLENWSKMGCVATVGNGEINFILIILSKRLWLSDFEDRQTGWLRLLYTLP